MLVDWLEQDLVMLPRLAWNLLCIPRLALTSHPSFSRLPGQHYQAWFSIHVISMLVLVARRNLVLAQNFVLSLNPLPVTFSHTMNSTCLLVTQQSQCRCVCIQGKLYNKAPMPKISGQLPYAREKCTMSKLKSRKFTMIREYIRENIVLVGLDMICSFKHPQRGEMSLKLHSTRIRNDC